jgi:hypothetical protein
VCRKNRERLFFVCWDKEQCAAEDFKFPVGLDKNLKSLFDVKELDKVVATKVGDILEPDDTIPEKMTISDKLWIGHQLRKERNRANGKGFGYSLSRKMRFMQYHLGPLLERWKRNLN